MSFRRLIFVTYASGSYKNNIFWNKLFVLLFIRPHKILTLTDVDLKKSRTYFKYKHVFDQKVGAGFWAWKPWAILQAMKVANYGDIIVYQDCGSGLKYKNFLKPKNIITYAAKYNSMPGIYIPIHGPNINWTHPTCFSLMDCVEDSYFNTPQVEASVSAWKVCSETYTFLESWLAYCTDIRVIGDSYDHNGSKYSHRYDQSVLTNLVIKHNLKPVTLSFDDINVSKSLSMIDLDLGQKSVLRKIFLKFMLFAIRLVRTYKSRFLT